MIQIVIAVIVSMFHPSYAAREGDLRAAVATFPEDRIEEVDYRAVSAALAVETRRVPAELLISIAWEESRFDPKVRTGRVCGVMQVNPADIDMPLSTCDAWGRDLAAGFAAGVAEIEQMLDEPRVHGDLHTALRYRACGNAAFIGACSAAKERWVRSVELAARAIARRVRPSA